MYLSLIRCSHSFIFVEMSWCKKMRSEVPYYSIIAKSMAHTQLQKHFRYVYPNPILKSIALSGFSTCSWYIVYWCTCFQNKDLGLKHKCWNNQPRCMWCKIILSPREPAYQLYYQHTKQGKRLTTELFFTPQPILYWILRGANKLLAKNT